MASKLAHALRASTGLTGLKYNPNARQALIDAYRQTLAVVAQMPADASYRKHVEHLTQTRLNVAEQETSVDAIESKINMGQAEELVFQAQNELSLAQKMLEWKPWLPLQEEPAANQWKWP